VTTCRLVKTWLPLGRIRAEAAAIPRSESGENAKRSSTLWHGVQPASWTPLQVRPVDYIAGTSLSNLRLTPLMPIGPNSVGAFVLF